MTTKKRLFAACALAWCLSPLAAFAQTPAPAAAPVPAAEPKMLTDADIKGVSIPSADEKAKDDPTGTITGTAADIPIADAKAGLTVADVVTMVGQHFVSTNFS